MLAIYCSWDIKNEAKSERSIVLYVVTCSAREIPFRRSLANTMLVPEFSKISHAISATNSQIKCYDVALPHARFDLP